MESRQTIVARKEKLRFASLFGQRLHVHHGQADAPGLGAKPLITLGHAFFRAILAAEPDRPLANQVAHHDPIVMALAHRDLVDPDHRWRRSSRLGQLGAHVLLVEFLHRMPVQSELPGDIPDWSAAAAPPHVIGKSLGVERIVRKELETLALDLAALPARNAPHFELQVYAQPARRKITSPAKLAVVPSGMLSSTPAADRFFDRRTGMTMRACGSPDTPRMSSTAKNRETGMHRANAVALLK